MEFFIIRQGQQAGPYSEDTLRSLLTNGTLRMSDMGWRRGLPAWLPISEVLSPGSERPTEPPPVSGVHSGMRARLATPRQKALLQFLNATFENSITREEAALAISDAFENPKLTTRLAKWGEEKLRLHPDLFQEELDFRRSTRVARYLELCQTEGSDVVKEITKAHVQVLMESLDKRHPTWEQNQHAALWDYLLPTMAEHFPPLVKDEWKGKLRLGGTSKVADAYAKAAGTGILTAEPVTPGPLQAAIRGVVYGLAALAVVIGVIYVARDQRKLDVTRNVVSSNPTKPAEALKVSPVSTAESEPPSKAPSIETAGAPNRPPDVAPNAAGPTPAATDPKLSTAAAANPVAPAMSEATAPAVTSSLPSSANAPFSPAPPPPGSTSVTPSLPMADGANPAAPTVRSTATLKERVTVQLQFGKVTLNPGTQVRLIALEGQNVRVNFNNNIVLVPISATDVDPANTVVAAPPVPLIPAITPTIPATPAVTASPTPSVPKPSSPSSDL